MCCVALPACLPEMRYVDYAGIMLLANFARYFKTRLTMEDFARLVAGRHSTRRFAPGELTQDEVVSILSAALQAPSSMNRRPWHFIVTDDRERLAALSRCKERGAAFVAGAAMAVVVCGDPLVSDVWIEDCSISAIMMQLAAEDFLTTENLRSISFYRNTGLYTIRPSSIWMVWSVSCAIFGL